MTAKGKADSKADSKDVSAAVTFVQLKYRTRKVREQEAIETRAEAAEAARAKAEEELANEKAEVERLAAECAHHQAELQVAAFMISTREVTETKLGKQARKLLGVKCAYLREDTCPNSGFSHLEN